MNNLIYLISVLILIVVYEHLRSDTERFDVPIRYLKPVLYPTTGPVDMLVMKKFLLSDYYRFQNTLVPPLPVNTGKFPTGTRDAFPDNFRQRTGVFKEKNFIEKFDGSASQATLAQVKSRDDQDHYLMGKAGVPIVDSLDMIGSFNDSDRPRHEREINYPNQEFSWGDVINRFYAKGRDHRDIVI